MHLAQDFRTLFHIFWQSVRCFVTLFLYARVPELPVVRRNHALLQRSGRKDFIWYLQVLRSFCGAQPSDPYQGAEGIGVSQVGGVEAELRVEEKPDVTPYFLVEVFARQRRRVERGVVGRGGRREATQTGWAPQSSLVRACRGPGWRASRARPRIFPGRGFIARAAESKRVHAQQRGLPGGRGVGVGRASRTCQVQRLPV